MTIQQAQASIGQPFKVTDLHGGILGHFDIILSVDQDGTIHGDFIEAHCEDCRLKQEQPEQLKKHSDEPSQKLLSCGTYGLHVIKNPAGTYSYVGSIPAALCVEKRGTFGIYMGSPTFQTMDEASQYFEDRKHLISSK